MNAQSDGEDIKRSAYPLFDKWVLWAHLPHDTDWSLKSYKEYNGGGVRGGYYTQLYNSIPEVLVKNCMLFLMRKGISPTWEDKQNRAGGCFSYKINNKNVYSVWKYFKLYACWRDTYLWILSLFQM